MMDKSFNYLKVIELRFDESDKINDYYSLLKKSIRYKKCLKEKKDNLILIKNKIEKRLNKCK